MHWAGIRAEMRQMPNLHLDDAQHRVGWYGVRGMSWTTFVHHLQLKVLFASPPKVVLIHLGGNDIEHLSCCRIRNLIKSGIRYVHAAFADCRIVWCNILPRLSWAKSGVYERKRKRVNRYGRQLCKSVHGDSLDIDIDVDTAGFFREDGIHLSDVGLEFMLDAVKDKLTEILD